MTTASVSLRVLLASVTMIVAAATAVAHDDDDRHDNRPDQFYRNTRLVSNGAFPANFTDPHLKNAWGVAFNPQGFVWVADADGNVSTLYDGTGQPSPQPTPLVVAVPGPDGYAGQPDRHRVLGRRRFRRHQRRSIRPGALHLRDRARQPRRLGAERRTLTQCSCRRIRATRMRAVYTGLALSGNGTTHLLYAANFLQGRIDVFDGTFKHVMCRAVSAIPPAGGLRAVRHPGDRRRPLRDLCETGRERRGRGAGTGPRLRRRVRSGGPLLRRSRARAAERAVGYGAGAGKLRRVRRRAAGRQSRRRHDQRLRSVTGKCLGSLRDANDKRCTSTACGASVRQRHPRPEDQLSCSTRRARTTKRMACTASSRQ